MVLLDCIFKNKVSKETFWAMLAKFISVISGVFFLIFIPRFSNVDTYGLFSLILAHIAIWGMFFGNSINNSIKKELAENKFNNISKKYFLSVLKIKSTIFIVALPVFLLLINIFNISILKDNFFRFAVLLFLMNFWGLVVTTFEASHRLFFTTIMYFVEYFSQIVLLVYFYFFGGLTLVNILDSFIIGYLLSFTIGSFFLFKQFSKQKDSDEITMDINTSLVAKKILLRTLYLTISGLALISFTKVDVLVVDFLMNIKEVGFYSIASDIAKQMNVLSLPIILGVVPIFAKKINEKKVFNKTILIIIAVNIFVVLFFLLSSGLLIKILYGENFSTVSGVLKILGFYPLIASLHFFVQEILIIRGRNGFVCISGIFAIMANILLNLLGVKIFGLTGAAIGTVTAYTLWLIVCLFFLLRVEKISSEK